MVYSGIVQEGEKRGRALGYPTANIFLNDAVLSGVYASSVQYRGNEYKGAVFADQHRHILEAHLLDFSGDMYGQEIEVEILQKIRENIRFDSDELLKSRIRKDIQLIRDYFKNL